MTNGAEPARTPAEQQLVDIASILASGILRLRDRQAQFSVMSRTNEAGFELLRRFRTFLKALDLYSEIKRRRAEESSVGIKEGEPFRFGSKLR
jgi:hypothetical protein